MAMEQTLADSSTAPDPFNGQEPTFEEYSSFRKSGELPARFKPAEANAATATVDAPEETVEAPEDEPESEPDEDAQEPPKGTPAQKRILQLLADKKELQRKLDAAKPVEPVQQTQQQPASPQLPQTRTKPTPEGKGPDGKPYETYEAYLEDLTDWKAEQHVARYKAEQIETQARNALKAKLDESRARYDDADDVIFPAAKTINEAQIPQTIKDVFAQSDVFTDLCYVVGSDPEELKKFVSIAQSNPRAALAKVFEYERGIREELAKDGTEEDDPKGKAPEKQSTKAPKPPSPVGGPGSRAFDVSDESLSPEAWARKRTEEVNRRKKG